MNKQNLPHIPESDRLTYLTVYDRPIQNRHSYSVGVLEVSSDNEPHQAVVQDVTELSDAALSFALLLLQEQVSPRHLADIVEDALPLK